MANCLKTAVTVCAKAKVFVDASRSCPQLFLTVLRVHGPQHCLGSGSQRFLSLQPPKKPAGAFFKFMSQKTQEIISRNPGASQPERCKLAGQLWRDLDPEEKEKLKRDAKEELQNYRQKYLAYVDQLTNQEKAKLLQERRERRVTRLLRRQKMELQRLGRPKKPPNSFNLFVKASRLQQGHAEPPDFLRGLVKSWKLMPEDKKEVYRVKAGVEKEKYLQEMTKWEQKMKEMGREDVIRKKSQKKSTSPSEKTVTGKKSTQQSSSKTSVQKTSKHIFSEE